MIERSGCDAETLAPGFTAFYQPLHDRFAARANALVEHRREKLARAHRGDLPQFLGSEAASADWRVELPDWCADQRNQMTGPADDAVLVRKMIDSGAPGVMLDLEDSIVDDWEHVRAGHENIIAALHGELGTKDTVIWNRVRGLHLTQHNFLDEPTPAALFDAALIAYRVDLKRTRRQTLCYYIPKSESADEGRWWSDVFDAICTARGWNADDVKCMALVESHPIAYEIEPFAYAVRRYLLGLNLGRWDYMASLIDFTLGDSRWVLPDRNTIPFDVPFFQRVRVLLPEICHKHGLLAIGGMTALFPDRSDAERNTRALEVLERDKRNEAQALMDGAWTGHPDQNAIAIAQFPSPNQLARRPEGVDVHADLRPLPEGVGTKTLQGTHAAARTVIRYRHGVLSGRGASLLDGYMEDLATDRIYRLMIAQRFLYPGDYTPASLDALFDTELQRIYDENPQLDKNERERYKTARDVSARLVATSLSSLKPE